MLGSGKGAHIALVGAGVALDGGAVEADAFFHGVAQVGGIDGESLEVAENIGEPETHELDVGILGSLQNIVLGCRVLGCRVNVRASRHHSLLHPDSAPAILMGEKNLTLFYHHQEGNISDNGSEERRPRINPGRAVATYQRHRRKGGAPGRTRTRSPWVRSPVLYPLSYRRMGLPEERLGRATGFEPVISCATDRRLDHSATLATRFYANKWRTGLQAHEARAGGVPNQVKQPVENEGLDSRLRGNDGSGSAAGFEIVSKLERYQAGAS